MTLIINGLTHKLIATIEAISSIKSKSKFWKNGQQTVKIIWYPVTFFNLLCLEGRRNNVFLGQSYLFSELAPHSEFPAVP